MDLFEQKVESVCSTEADTEACINGFKKWRPFITNFLKRAVLRVAREIQPETLCNLGNLFWTFSYLIHYSFFLQI